MRKGVIAIVLLLALGASASANGQKSTEETSNVHLVVWDQWDDNEGDVRAIEMIHERFLADHPGVTLERVAMPEMSDVLRPALQAGKGPDVIYSEVGVGFIGPILKAGYIMDLTDHWEDRGWSDALFPIARDIPTVAGVTYGVGHELEFVPIYYNKDIFRSLGLEPPTTMDELEQVAETVQAAGYVPFAWGGLDWWTQSNLTTSVLWAWLGEEKALAGMDQGGRWDHPETVEAIDTVFVDWVDRGFFPKNLAAFGYNDQQMMFAQGEAAMFPTGNWIVGSFIENIGDDFEIGSFLWPALRSGGPTNTVSFVGSGYIVNAGTEHPETAIDYLDAVLADPESAKIWYETANKIPPLRQGIDVEALDVHPLTRQTLDSLTDPDAATTAGLAMAAPPEVMTFLRSSAVEVVTGLLTPQDWADEFQRLWDEGRAAGQTKDAFEF